MLKFLVDESSGRKVAETLLQDDFDAISAIRLMRSAKDKVILKKAVNDDRILMVMSYNSFLQELWDITELFIFWGLRFSCPKILH